MSASDLVIVEEDHRRLTEVLDRLRRDANAKLAFLLNKNGQQVALSGDLEEIDPTALASLTAGNVAATDGLAQLVGEREFEILFHEGVSDHLHINVVGGRMILLVRFDERSSLGLVRLRVKKATPEIAAILEDVAQRRSRPDAAAPEAPSPFAEITDDDIDALFS